MKKATLFLSVVGIAFLSSCNKEPDVAFTASASEVTAGEAVTFSNSSDKNTYDIGWNFGDGGSANTWDASHVYQNAGEYTVTLTGRSKKGNKQKSVTSKITVNPRPGEISTEITNMVVGTWNLTSAKYTGTPCGSGSPTSYTHSSNATKMVLNVVGPESGYMTNHTGEKEELWFDILDENTITMSEFDVPMSGGFEMSFPYGVYSYSVSGSTMTLTLTQDRFNSSDNCYDLYVYTVTFTKS